MSSPLYRLILLTSLALFGTGAGRASSEGLTITVQPGTIRFHGEVPDPFTAIGLHQITALAAPEARCLDDVAISPTAPAIRQPRLLAGLLSELSVSTDSARVILSGNQLTLETQTASRVTEIAIVTRLNQLKSAGFEIKNQVKFVQDASPIEPPIQFASRSIAISRRPAFDAAFLISESERRTLELAESLVAEATAARPSPSSEIVAVAAPLEPEPEPEIVKSPLPPGITFPPETFVLTGRLRTRVSDFADEIFGRDDLGEQSVTLRITLPTGEGASFSRWMAEEQLESVKLGLIGRGVDTSFLRTEIVQPKNPADLFENHIAILVPPAPAIVEAVPQDEERAILVPAQEVSSLSVPLLTP